MSDPHEDLKRPDLMGDETLNAALSVLADSLTEMGNPIMAGVVREAVHRMSLPADRAA